MRIIMTALAPLECRHPRLGQSLWRLGVMKPQCVCVWVGGCVCGWMDGCVGGWVCMCDAPSFQQNQSVHYHTSPLYSIVRTAAIFGSPPHAAFPPSQHDMKTMYS